MQEWKSSLHTKDRQTAQRKWVEENQKFDEAEKLATIIAHAQQGTVSAYGSVQMAKQIALDAGFHPDQAPQLPTNPTDDDWTEFKVQRKDWLEWVDLQRKLIAETDA